MLVRSSVENAAPFHIPTVPHWGGPHIEVDVTYTHGLTAVPEEVKDVCIELCSLSWSNPTMARSFSIDGYSASFGGGRESNINPLERLKGWHRRSGSVKTS